jgi:predicted nucleic acid-binding protein
MSVLVDTGVLYADHDRDATRHETAAAALEAVYDGEFGNAYVSEYVYDEAVTLALRRSGSFDAAETLGRRLRGADPYPAAFDVLHVSPGTFETAVETFERYDDQRLSFTDAVQISQCERRGIEAVLTFDSDFDGLVERVSPGVAAGE